MLDIFCRIGIITVSALHSEPSGLPRLNGGSVAPEEVSWQFPVTRINLMFAIKTAVSDLQAKTFAFPAQKTMYGGKQIAKGDAIFIFASENEGGPGLVARGVITSAKGVARKPGIARQTPRVSITIRRTACVKRRLGRSELKRFSNWNDGGPETELNFKFYRQATNKIVGISDKAAAFLRRFF